MVSKFQLPKISEQMGQVTVASSAGGGEGGEAEDQATSWAEPEVAEDINTSWLGTLSSLVAVGSGCSCARWHHKCGFSSV